MRAQNKPCEILLFFGFYSVLRTEFYFFFRKSFIETLRFQWYFIRRQNCAKHNITMRSIIKLQGNITRRQANKTAECPLEHSANDPFFAVLENI